MFYFSWSLTYKINILSLCMWSVSLRSILISRKWNLTIDNFKFSSKILNHYTILSMSSSLASNRVLSTCLILNFIKPEFVGDKVKKVNLKAGVKRKQSTPNFWKTSISFPLIHISLCVYQGVRNICFSENLACFVFFLPPFWISLFHRRISQIRDH